MIPQSLQDAIVGRKGDLSIDISHCSEWTIFLTDCAVSLEGPVEMVRHPDLSTALSKMADLAVKYA